MAAFTDKSFLPDGLLSWFNFGSFLRFAKRKLDDYSFFGSELDVSYAPQYEVEEDTMAKLKERQHIVAVRKRRECPEFILASPVPCLPVFLCHSLDYQIGFSRKRRPVLLKHYDALCSIKMCLSSISSSVLLCSAFLSRFTAGSSEACKQCQPLQSTPCPLKCKDLTPWWSRTRACTVVQCTGVTVRCLS